MPSILPTFEYDIFISYRHNDNLDGWVTDFVQNLEKELKATLKDQLTIYFDRNLQDGLLETHNVDKSLEGKLKCLIFIPILSQTYCDPKSFAWQHEFVAFNKLTKEDQFARDIKLSNGNVASRILPIKIHDLDAEDKVAIENEIGGVLRAIEFIYKEPGVNRPLLSNDSLDKNLNKTIYRNQVNKVANAIKEIITALKTPIPQSTRTTNNQQLPNPTKSKTKFILTCAIVIALIIASYFLYSKFLSAPQNAESNEKAIAVLPFVNMSGDTEQEYFSDGLTEELLNLLAKTPELRVIGRTSSFSFKGKNEDLRTIGEKLGVTYILEGSVRRSGNNLRITSQLIRARDGSHLWSETYDRQMQEVFSVQDEIAAQVVGQLKIKIGLINSGSRTKNLEAYNLLLESKFLGQQDLSGANKKRIDLMTRALSLDSTDATLWVEMAMACMQWDGHSETRKQLFEKARTSAERAIALDPQLAEAHFALGEAMRSYFWNWPKAEAEFNMAKKLSQQFAGATYSINYILGKFDAALEDALMNVKNDPLNANSWSTAANAYRLSGNSSKGIEFYKKELELRPFSDDTHVNLALAYMEEGLVKEAFAELEKVTDRNFGRLLGMYGRIHASLGDFKKANEYLKMLLQSDEKPNDNSIFMASILAVEGKNEEAIKWLNIAYERKTPSVSFIYIAVVKRQSANKKFYPAFYGLRNEPEFKTLLRKLNFPDAFEN